MGFINQIIQIKTEERKARLQVIQNLLRLNPNPELLFSNAVKKTSNPTRSTSPTGSEQESQSNSSSEDTNVTIKFYENFVNEEHNSPTVPTYGHEYYTKGKGKNERSPPSSLCSVGGVRVKISRK